jgi:hypothetical protein
MKNHSKIYFCFLAVFLLIYGPCISTTFAFSDDYSIIWEIKNNHYSDIILFCSEGGRLVYGLYFIIWSFISNINDFVWLRSFCIAGLAALALLFTEEIKEKTKLPLFLTVGVSALIGLTPSMQVFASWGVCAIQPWAAWIAGLSYRSLERTNRPIWQSKIISLFLLLISISIYQPAAMIFWCLAAISWLFTENARSLPKQFFVALSIMGMAMATDYGLAKLLPEILFSTSNSVPRTALATNFIQKILWFINEPLVDAFNFPRIVNDKFYAYWAELFTAIGLLIYFFKHRSFIFWKIFLVLALIPLTYLPNLLVQENWVSYRTQIALTTLVVIYEVMAVVGWLSLFRLKKYIPVVILMAVIICGWQAHRHVVTEFAKPQVRELMAVDYYLRKIQCTNAQSVYLVPSTWMSSFAPLVRYDEFGLPSSAQPWSLQGMAWLILKKQHNPLANQLLDARIGHLSQVPPDACIIDFGRALEHFHSDEQ